MRKHKLTPEPAPPKRKRARRSKPGDGAPIGGGKQYTDWEISRIYRRIERNETPHVFAVTARQLGFVRARPRDFFCLCPPHDRTGIPDCSLEVDGCPYAGRFSPAEIERPGAYAWLMARINRIITARAAQRRPSTTGARPSKTLGHLAGAASLNTKKRPDPPRNSAGSDRLGAGACDANTSAPHISPVRLSRF